MTQTYVNITEYPIVTKIKIPNLGKNFLSFSEKINEDKIFSKVLEVENPKKNIMILFQVEIQV